MLTIIQNDPEAGTPVLRAVAKPVAIHDEAALRAARELGAAMLEAMRPTGVGLAANQVGQLVRVIVMDPGGDPWVMLNPTIVKASPELQLSREGCLSVGHGYTTGYVYRHKRVTVEFVDTSGCYRKHKFAGLPAAIVQHEIDHLDGVLWTDKEVRRS